MKDTTQPQFTPVNLQQEQVANRGRFPAGKSGNPAGRRPGSQNRATTMLKSLDNDDLEDILSVLVVKAKSGDLEAIKLIMGRLIPPARAPERFLKFQFDKVESLTDLRSTASNILQAIANGDISASDALKVTEVLERLKPIVEMSEFEKRVIEMEKNVYETS